MQLLVRGLMKIISWNLNGIKSAISKGLSAFVKSEAADILLFQETRADKFELPEEFESYNLCINPAKRKGYSGTMSLWKKNAICKNGIGIEEFDVEGRIQTLELGDLFIINAYFPNSQRDLARLKYKLAFDEAIETYAKKLSKEKGTILAGDMNVAHEEIDLANPKDNANNAGFTLDEREWMSHFFSSGFVDTYRHFHKDPGHYTWWSNFANARSRNIGWRIDYFIADMKALHKIKDSIILEKITGSDHAPIELILSS